jgi:hypothetical protein
LHHAHYRAARADPGRRFHALYDKVCRGDVLWCAWGAVRSNNGAPGIDKPTLAAVEEYVVARLLDELASELREKRYRPLPARRVLIPKPGTTEQRPSSIPTEPACCAVAQARCGFGVVCHGDAPVSSTSRAAAFRLSHLSLSCVVNTHRNGLSARSVAELRQRRDRLVAGLPQAAAFLAGLLVE